MFLPGIVMPAALRYAALFDALGAHRARAIARDLHVADIGTSAETYSIDREIEVLDRALMVAGIERFHMYGHSGGAAVALAYVAEHPRRVLTLTLDEPSTDFTDEDLSDPDWSELLALRELAPDLRLPEFRRLQVAPGVPVPLPDPLPGWLEPAPSRIVMFNDAAARHRVAPARYAGFEGPVHYTYGALTRARYAATHDRLSAVFQRFSSERFDGLHHLRCAHQAVPERVAAVLRRLWREGSS